MGTVKKVAALFLGLYITVGCVRAQHSYRFEETAGTYKELQNPDIISSPGFGTSTSHYIDLYHETFEFYNKPYTFERNTSLYITAQGDIRVYDDTSTIVIAGALTRMDVIDTTTRLAYSIEGTTGDKILKVEWKNVRLRFGPDTSNYANLQIWLHQFDGVIEIYYGPSAYNDSGFVETGQQAGPHVGLLYTSGDYATLYEKLWITNFPGKTQQDTAGDFYLKAMKGLPPEGTVYRFIPRSVPLTASSVKKEEISFYPNPAHAVVYASLPASGYITDMQGRKVAGFANTTEINICHLLPGIYVLHTEESSTQKLLVQ